jgi:hypothetical protein
MPADADHLKAAGTLSCASSSLRILLTTSATRANLRCGELYAQCSPTGVTGPTCCIAGTACELRVPGALLATAGAYGDAEGMAGEYGSSCSINGYVDVCIPLTGWAITGAQQCDSKCGCASMRKHSCLDLTRLTRDVAVWIVNREYMLR